MEPPSSGRVSVINNSGKKLKTAAIIRAVNLALAQHSSVKSSVCVLLTNDDEVRDLNARFRGLDAATDVLSFPAGEMPGAPLGDIAIAVPYAERQAAVRQTPLDVELQYLAIHGALHLLGFDDETPEDRERMLGEMNTIGLLAGLPPEPEWSSILHGETDERG
jgi:rRNA maturation RNase YbeY